MPSRDWGFIQLGSQHCKECQHSFRKNYSCMYLHTPWYPNINYNCQLKKAFEMEFLEEWLEKKTSGLHDVNYLGCQLTLWFLLTFLSWILSRVANQWRSCLVRFMLDILCFTAAHIYINSIMSEHFNFDLAVSVLIASNLSRLRSTYSESKWHQRHMRERSGSSVMPLPTKKPRTRSPSQQVPL